MLEHHDGGMVAFEDAILAQASQQHRIPRHLSTVGYTLKGPAEALLFCGTGTSCHHSSELHLRHALEAHHHVIQAFCGLGFGSVGYGLMFVDWGFGFVD